ncbi:acetyl-CoA decarbonylase/synthase complex subunit alpha [candidate division MSBL1 archaeon SCGC-AAA261D19]|uniref:Acetyl-CoA decarbonylase/synthase complex subunit alpha n=1 Tax=candidate division MSBL1 archaeon SCGC-AAA261D19 TaxID=1698273 RepID=A0A133V8I7_9EURY|nr:acetyl-CoA decarbonylase/synthase complex subunit alpha [candidate division MSBL1 archaeon SCGC-AAA261D19]
MAKDRLKLEKFESKGFTIEGLDLSIEEILDETADWEPLGPTPFPGMIEMRDWDFRLMKRYRPQYYPACESCCFCGYGKCDLQEGKEGACGIKLNEQVARKNFMRATWGLAAHAGHARHMLHKLIDMHGPELPLDMGSYVDVEAPNIRTVCGIKPKTLADLREVLDYVEEEFLQMVSALHTGQEGNNLDFESKALNAGMLDHVAMEAADIAQIASYDMPRGDPEAPLVDIGMGTLNPEKPCVLCYGHNLVAAADVIKYVEENNLWDEVEVGGICCTVLDMTRTDQNVNVVGGLSSALKFIRAGVADVVVTDEQCIRTDTFEEATAVGSKVIATSEKVCYGLQDRTDDSVDKIVEDLVNSQDGVLITNLEKVGEVATKVAQRMSPKRGNLKVLPTANELKDMVDKCTQCGSCRRNCPNDYPLDEAMASAQEGDYSKLSHIFTELCLGCGRCEEKCPQDIKIFQVMEKAAEKEVKEEKYKIRIGRGPIRDTEIRKVGSPIVLGEIPGVIALVGCPNYPGSKEPLYRTAKELASRNYIIAATGCHAMDMSFFRNGEGKTIWEQFPGDFDGGGVCNVGSCVANSHITGAAIKIANIFAKIPLRANYKEIADYILNRVGACGISWGAYSQKAVSIANGVQRLGIPVILGPRCSLYGRSMLGRRDREGDWTVKNKRNLKKEGRISPGPEHLCYYAESPEEMIVKAVKLCIRPNDTDVGRQIKLSHYIDLYNKYFDEKYPPDLYMYVRRDRDIPIKDRTEVMKMLKEDERWEKGKFGIDQPTILREGEF